MPFDAASLGTGFDEGAGELGADAFIPFEHHISPGVVLLADVSVMATIEFPGFPFQLQSRNTRNMRRRQVSRLWKNIADEQITLATHFVRYRRDAAPFRTAERGFIGRFGRRQREQCLGGAFENKWFLSVIVSPLIPVASRALLKLREIGLVKHPQEASDDAISKLEDVMFILEAFFRPYGGRRLGIKRNPGTRVRFSEIGRAMRLVLYGRDEEVPITAAPLRSGIYNDRATCGLRGLEVRGASGRYFGRVLSLKEYPEETVTGQLDELLSLPWPCVLSQSFRFHSRAQSQTSLTLKRIRTENAGAATESVLEELDRAEDEVGHGHSVRGSHHLSLTVFADTAAELDRASAEARKRLNNAGANAVVEDRGCFGAYWGALAGAADWLKTRPARINTRNFSALSSFDGFARGCVGRTPYWGRPAIRFLTTGATTFDYEPHVGDLGHTLLVGVAGSGKTLMLGRLALALLPLVEETSGFVCILDKDQGNYVLARMLDGYCVRLRAGQDSGLVPVRALTNTPGNVDFLCNWIKGLVLLDGAPLEPGDEEKIARGVRRVMRLPPSLRSLAAVRQFLGFRDADGTGRLGERFERWCRGGAQGWVFDGGEDHLRFGASIVCIDMTEILEHEACPAVGSYILHRIREKMDGRRIAVLMDELKAYLRSDFFAHMIENFVLVARKLETLVALATQQPEHLTASPVGASIIAQCASRFLFPQRSLDVKAYVKAFGCTAAMIRQLSEEMPVLPMRTVLLQSEEESVVLQTELPDMDDEIAVLSSRAATAGLVDRLIEQHGDDPEAWAPHFFAQYRAVLRKEERDARRALRELEEKEEAA